MGDSTFVSLKSDANSMGSVDSETRRNGPHSGTRSGTRRNGLLLPPNSSSASNAPLLDSVHSGPAEEISEGRLIHTPLHDPFGHDPADAANVGPPPPEPPPPAAAVVIPWHWYSWLWMNPKAQFAWMLAAIALSACLSNSWQPYSSMLFGHDVFLHWCSDYEIEIHREITSHLPGDDFGRYEPACRAQNAAIGILYAAGAIAVTLFTIASRTCMQCTSPTKIAAIGTGVLVTGFILLGAAPVTQSGWFVLATLFIGGSWGFVMGPAGDACGYWGRYKNYAHALMVAANSCSSFLISLLDSLIRNTPGSFREIVLGYVFLILIPVAFCYVIVVYIAHSRKEQEQEMQAEAEEGSGSQEHAIAHAVYEAFEQHNQVYGCEEIQRPIYSADSESLVVPESRNQRESLIERGADVILNQFDDGILDPFCVPIESHECKHRIVPDDASLFAAVCRPEFIIFSLVMMITSTGMHFYTVTLRGVAGEQVARFMGFIMPLVLLWDYMYGLSVNYIGMTFLWFVQIICLGLSFVCTFASRHFWHYVGTVLYTLCSAFNGHLIYVFTNEYIPTALGWRAQNILNILNILSVLINYALTNVTDDMAYIANCILGAVLVALLGISSFQVFVRKHERALDRKKQEEDVLEELRHNHLHHPQSRPQTR